VICGLCTTPYDGDECPTCREEREGTKRVIGERARRDEEEWLEEPGREPARLQDEVTRGLNNRWVKPVAALLALGTCAICLTLGVFCFVYLLLALVG
jgi:hypothetical protein